MNVQIGFLIIICNDKKKNNFSLTKKMQFIYDMRYKS